MMRKLICLLIAAAVSLLPTAAANPVTIYKDGKSDFQIVLPDKHVNPGTDAYLKEAATIFQDIIKQASGITIPVVKESEKTAGKPGIYIGNTAAARQAGLQPDQFKNFDGVIAAINGNLFIAGHDHHGYNVETRDWNYARYILGSVKALVVFMEKYMNVKFLMPGDIGTHVPEAAALAIPGDLRVDVKPPLVFAQAEHFSLLYDYANNNYGFGGFWSYGGHSYYKAVPVKEYGQSHPEYFILQEGTRRIDSTNHLCISNPDVQELIYKEVLKRCDEGAETVELAQTDGYLQCECENCKKFGNTDDKGEKLWILHRSLAERLLKDRPGKNVLIISYNPTVAPPKTFNSFPPNVIIQLCWYAPEDFAAWSKIDVPNGFTVYTYHWGSYNVTGFTPKHTPAYCHQQAKFFLDNKVKGIFRCGFTGESFGMEAPSYYVFGKTIDDPSQNPAVLAEDFYKNAFMEAAGPMREFYRSLGTRLSVYEEGSYHGSTRGLGSNPRIVLAYIYSPDVIETLSKNLDRAEKIAVNPKVKKRLAFIRAEFTYVKNLAEIIHLHNAYRLRPTQNNFDQLAAEIDKRNEYIAKVFGDDPKLKTAPAFPGWPELRIFGQGNTKELVPFNGRLSATIGTPLTWDTKILRDNHVLPGVGTKQFTIIKAVGDISKEDLNTGAWAKAQWNDLNGISLDAIDKKTRFKAVYDKDCVYFGVEADLDAKREFKAVGNDGAAYNQDCVEFLLDPLGNKDIFYHFIYNPIPNSRYDAAFGLVKDPLDPLYNGSDKNWNGEWETFNVRKGDKWYSVVKIPFATLKVSTTASGSQWTMNVGREAYRITGAAHEVPEISLWSPNLENRRIPDREAFGAAVFE